MGKRIKQGNQLRARSGPPAGEKYYDLPEKNKNKAIHHHVYIYISSDEGGENA